MRILILDTETTGLPKTKFLNPLMFHLWPHIVQLSYIIYDTEIHELIKIQDFIIRVPADILISDESIKIHGITNEMSRTSGVDISEAFETLFEDSKQADIHVCHNVDFDLNQIKIELLRLIHNDMIPHSTKSLYKDMLYRVTYVILFRCSMRETTDYCNILTKSKKGDTYKKFPSLTELYQKLFNESPKNLHNSLHDVLVTLICFVKFNYNINILEKCVEIQNLVRTYQIV